MFFLLRDSFMDFQQFADEIKEEVRQEDYKTDDVVTIPILRIHQDKTQNPPEDSEPGMFYSPTAGFCAPSKTVYCTIIDMVNIRQLWTPFSARNKHIICKSYNQATGYGNPFIEEEGRWIPGEEKRECAACPYNAFRNRGFEPIDVFEYGNKDLPLTERCKSGKLFAGFKLPSNGEEITLERVLPFYFQVGSSIFSNAYTALRTSWEAFVVGCNQVNPPIPWLACKLNMSTQQINTPSGFVWVPVFELAGVHIGALQQIRAIEGAYQERLALKDAEVQPEIENDE